MKQQKPQNPRVKFCAAMAAKRTPGLIPLCHSPNLTKCAVDFTLPPESCSGPSRR